MVGYFIESLHTSSECLEALREVLQQGSEVLAQFYWGCAGGDHTGYAVVEAASQYAAEQIVPGTLRRKARVVEVEKFSPEQIKAVHQEH